ncbi:ABC transporter permease [Leucobacter sp. UT-8R-CII-1-4]|uniref:ABC transporter permease n=1 Tax=Leucobacter sp. UT-8R-CII-1-4 TaxID=3040075 RepID=UPI0024A93594|nr:ABC transporter permease [Leucobacter sp. UT-8R-CII-1-4]MDI6023576.1 ABC transporter permease [Leucobacter sp. UT-8R-CII-1-4]
MNSPTQNQASTTSGSRSAGSAQRISAAQATWLVAEREISTKLRSKAFLISTGMLLLLVLGTVLFSGISSNTGGFGGPTKVAVVAETANQVSTDTFEVTTVADRAAAEAAVLDETVDAAVVPDASSPAGVAVLAADSPPMSLVQALSVSPEIELLAPTAENPMLAYFIAIAFGVVFMMSAITFGATIAQSVVEEKQTRIVEILLATVSARSILAGKILGNSILALGQVVAIAALSSVGMLATGQDLLLGELGTALIWFAILFAFGFVLLASLYAALASLVSRQEDVGSAISPVMWLVMIPYIAIVAFSTDLKILAIMSYVPLSAPIGMPMRLYLGVAEWWEPLLSLGVLAVSIAIVWWLGARIYEGSILRTGAKVKLKDALAAKD